jgi:hypothetical protein
MSGSRVSYYKLSEFAKSLPEVEFQFYFAKNRKNCKFKTVINPAHSFRAKRSVGYRSLPGNHVAIGISAIPSFLPGGSALHCQHTDGIQPAKCDTQE